jgi:hypothetical protein
VRKERALATMRELQLAEFPGTLVPTATVETAWAEAIIPAEVEIALKQLKDRGEALGSCRNPSEEYNSAVFDPIEKPPRGFNGRPLIALLIAVGAGFLVRPVSKWLNLNETLVFLIIEVVILALGLAWYRIERPK